MVARAAALFFHGLLQELPPDLAGNDLGDKRWHRISKHALHVIATAVELQAIWERLKTAQLL